MMLSIDKMQKLLPFPIKQKLQAGTTTIVLIDDDQPHGSEDVSLNRNIYAFREDSMLWQIQESPDGGSEWPKPYTSMAHNGNDVIVQNWNGTSYVLCLDDGRVVAHGPRRRPW